MRVCDHADDTAGCDHADDTAGPAIAHRVQNSTRVLQNLGTKYPKY